MDSRRLNVVSTLSGSPPRDSPARYGLPANTDDFFSKDEGVRAFLACFNVVRRGWRLILLVGLIATFSTLLLRAGTKSLFQASVEVQLLPDQACILQTNEVGGPSALFQPAPASEALSNEVVILSSSIVVDRALELSGLKPTAVQGFLRDVSVRLEDEAAYLVSIRVVAAAPEDARQLAKSVVRSYKEFLELQTRREEAIAIAHLERARDRLRAELSDLEKEYREWSLRSATTVADPTKRQLTARRLEELHASNNSLQLIALLLKASGRVGNTAGTFAGDNRLAWSLLSRILPNASRAGFPGAPSDGKPVGGVAAEVKQNEMQEFAWRHKAAALNVSRLEAELAAVQPSTRSLERAFGAEAAVVKLREERVVLQAKLNAVERLARSAADPSILNLRKEIRKSQEKERRIWEERESPLREQLLQNERRHLNTMLHAARVDLLRSEARAQTLVGNATQRPEKPLASDHLLLEALDHLSNTLEIQIRENDAAFLAAEMGWQRERDLKAQIASHNALIRTLVEALATARRYSNAQRVAVTKVGEPKVRPTGNGAYAAALMALFFGCVAGGLITIAAEWSNPRFRNLNDLRNWSGLPLIGRIPRQIDPETAAHSDSASLGHLDPCSPPAESYKAARTVLEALVAKHGARVLVVSSPRPASGASTVAINLATVLAQAGRRTLLIDGDLLQPSLHRAFGLPCESGLTEVLLGSGSLSELARPTGVANLKLLCAGSCPHCPIDLIASVPLGAYLHNSQSDYDVVILGASPLLESTATLLLASAADGLVLVLRIGSSTREDVERAEETACRAGVRIFGVLACH
jgi:capsular exopolysaccharide synthesis family protein